MGVPDTTGDVLATGGEGRGGAGGTAGVGVGLGTLNVGRTAAVGTTNFGGGTSEAGGAVGLTTGAAGRATGGALAAGLMSIGLD